MDKEDVVYMHTMYVYTKSWPGSWLMEGAQELEPFFWSLAIYRWLFPDLGHELRLGKEGNNTLTLLLPPLWL